MNDGWFETRKEGAHIKLLIFKQILVTIESTCKIDALASTRMAVDYLRGLRRVF